MQTQMIFSAALTIISFGTQATDFPDVPVSLEIPESTLSDSLAALSSKLALKLEISADLANLPSTIYATKVPSAKLLNAISDTYYASWRRTKSGWILERTSDQRSKIKSQLALERKELAEKWVRTLSPRVNGAFPGSWPAFSVPEPLTGTPHTFWNPSWPRMDLQWWTC